MIVIDASALIEALMLTPSGLGLAERIFESGSSLHASELLDLEVAQVVRRYLQLGDITEARAGELLEDLSDFAIERYRHRPLMSRVWELRAKLSTYDAAYVALAEAFDAPLVTADRRLANAPHRARVEVV